MVEIYKSDIEVLDLEMESFEEEIKRYLTFDLVKPQNMEGKVGLHEINLNIEMDNGDVIELFSKHKSYPGDSTEEFNEVYINGKTFDLSEIDDHPGYFIRAYYKPMLMEKLKRGV